MNGQKRSLKVTFLITRVCFPGPKTRRSKSFIVRCRDAEARSSRKAAGPPTGALPVWRLHTHDPKGVKFHRALTISFLRRLSSVGPRLSLEMLSNFTPYHFVVRGSEAD